MISNFIFVGRVKACIIFAGLFLFSACAGHYRVPVSHVLALSQDEKEFYEALRNVYILIDQPLQKKSGSKQTGIPGKDAAYFARLIDERISEVGGSVFAYRMVAGYSEEDYFTKYLKPSAVLYVELNDFNIDYSRRVEEVKVRDYEGNETIKKVIETVYSAYMRVHVKFDSVYLEETLVEDDLYIGWEMKFNENPSDRLYVRIKTVLFEMGAQKIKNLIAPGHVVRYRSLFKTKDKDSAKALRFVRSNNWSKAEDIWNSRLAEGKGNWKDEFNLGVAGERRNDIKKSVSHYKKAQEGSAGAKESKNIRWDNIFSDLSSVFILAPRAAEVQSDWFRRKIAVLPPSEETVSIDGPILVRQLIYLALKEGGYNVVDIETVDSLLRDHGFSEGGQFGATTPEKIAGWLGSDMILFTHLEEYNKINVGIYVNKSIIGRVSVWDAFEKKEIWSASKQIIVHSLPSEVSKAGILGHFLGNLAESWAERAGSKPLYQEAQRFVIDNIGQLPLKPAKQK